MAHTMCYMLLSLHAAGQDALQQRMSTTRLCYLCQPLIDFPVATLHKLLMTADEL